MTSLCAVVFLALVAFAAASIDAERWNKPDYCREYDCPPFRMIKKTQDYELHEYEPTVWVTVRGGDTWRWYSALHDYMHGHNQEHMQMHMTVPVVKIHAFDPESYFMGTGEMMAFYVNTTNPPMPTDPNVTIMRVPTQRMYLRCFGGWTNSFIAQREATALLRAIGRDGDINTRQVHVSQFNSPWTFFGRYNCVAFIAE